MLAHAIALELLQAVPRRNVKVIEGFGRIDGDEFAKHYPAQIGRITSNRLPAKEALSIPVAEALDHLGS